MVRRFIAAAAAVAALAASSLAQTVITKPPDIGPWWNPINPNSGTYVYASDFVLNAPDTNVTHLGTWLELLSGNASSGRFEIWGDTGGNGPDPNNVLVSTGSVNPAAQPGGLTFFEYPASGASLSQGSRYWFVITVVGESGDASWRTGGHTQNSVYNDNGTFWYSNDANGQNFDGQGLTPQIAFQVRLGPAGGGRLFYSQDNNPDGLYTLNTTTGAATHVGQSGVTSNTVGLAPSETDSMLWGSTWVDLVRIRTDGSGFSTIGQVFAEGLGYDRSTNTLYGSINGSFFEVDQSSGANIPLPAPPGDVEGLAVGRGGIVFGLARFDQNLYRYNPGTGMWGTVGNTGVSWDLAGLAYDPGGDVLYAKGFQDSFLYAIDPQTGATRRIGDTGIAEGGGLAFVGAGGDDCFDSIGCPGDVDGDGDADVNDFFAFLDLFASGDDCADLDDDGDVDVNDFFSYLDLFAQGC